MNKRIPILLGFLLVALAIWMQITNISYLEHFISRLENVAYDIQLRSYLLTHKTPFKSSVAIIDIDDKSLIKEGRWPWPRSKLAALISRAQEAGAVVVALDMFFSQPENNIAQTVEKSLAQNNPNTELTAPMFKKIMPLFDNDAILAASLKQIDSVLGVSFTPEVVANGIMAPPVLKLKTPAEKQLQFFNEEGYLGNIPVLQQAAKSSGFINAFADDDGIIRRAPLFLRYQDQLYPSLALEAVRLFLLSDIKLVTADYGDEMHLEGVMLGNYMIPTDQYGQVIVPFRGSSFTFPFYSATDVLNKKIPADALQGKIIFIGTSATGLGDLKPTSVQNIFPGVEIQATIADGILTNNFSYKPAWELGAEIFLTTLLGIVFALSFPFLGPRLITLVIICVPGFLIVANNWLWEETGVIISVFIPIVLGVLLALLNMIYGYLFETRKREQLKSIFGQYVPGEHIDAMLKTSDSSFGMYGEDRDMTVIFADIRNFTTISENLTATQLKDMLNDFFTPMTEIIFKHHGTIDKYVGDLIMAFWGAPLKDKRHAQHALSAALEMLEKVEQLKPALLARGWPEINIGIGLNSGLMSVGDMGSTFRRNYTVLGDAVNLASRVESLTKFYGVKLMTTEFTVKEQKNFVIRQLDRVRVKGKVAGIGIFEVICRKNQTTPELEKEIADSELALHYYFQREWTKSQTLFFALAKRYPTTRLYQLYLERLIDFEITPPPEDWGGIYTHLKK